MMHCEYISNNVSQSRQHVTLDLALLSISLHVAFIPVQPYSNFPPGFPPPSFFDPLITCRLE